MIGLIVGSFYYPPAKALLAAIPRGTPLSIVPEPENPYDSSAIKVLLQTNDIPPVAYAELESSLLEFGTQLRDVLASGTMQVGHLAKTGNKALRDGLRGNTEFTEAQVGGWPAEGHLAFSPDGKPLFALGRESERGQ